MSDKLELRFKKQQFQVEAAASVVNVFEGQPFLTATFKADQGKNRQYTLPEEGFGNHRLRLSPDEIKANIVKVQRKNLIKPLETMLSPCQLTVEMETGTGKTYTYIKTMYELNRLYGWSKFIIVVPSIAIREGVAKSFEVMQKHFREEYGKTIRGFIYNSKNLNEIDVFASNKDIHAMIINSQAFNAKGKDARRIYMELDEFASRRPIDVLAKTNPILIIDEPQSVDNTPKAKDAIQSLNPLAVFRYSATHREKINLLYRLTPIDAYQMGLVKQICVSSNSVANDFNKPYIMLKSVSNENGFSAKIEIDVQKQDAKVERQTFTVKPGADLYQLSGRELYEGYVIEGIDCTKDYECIEFSNSETVNLGKAIGSVDENIIKKAQIYRTIETHLEKELRYHDKGIKVLSLFFIDEVKNTVPKQAKKVFMLRCLKNATKN